MSGLLWLLLVSVTATLLAGWWRHRRDQRQLRRWVAELEHAEYARGNREQVCWKWPVVK